MPSSAAQKYFNSFDPEEQQRIRQSWGGGDLMDEWYKNAQAAGSVDASGNTRDANVGQGMSENEALAANEAANANISGASGLKKGQTPTPTQLRQYAREMGWSEDFNRFNDATLNDWIKNNWDTGAMKFRSAKKDESGKPLEGFVEKPDETPEGWVAWGQGAVRTEEAERRKSQWGQPKTQAPPQVQSLPQQQQQQQWQMPTQNFDWTKFDWTKFGQGEEQKGPIRTAGTIKTDRTATPRPTYNTWQRSYGPQAGRMQANKALSTDKKFAGPISLGM